MLKHGIGAVPHIVELGENIVPDFHISVAVTAGLAIRAAATVLFAAVKINLAAGTAGACAVLPEVIRLAKLYNMLLGDTDFIAPDRVSLVILLINRGPKQIFGDFKNLSQELPSPLNSLLLKVIPKGEVAEHLKICAVARGMTDALKVGGADTFLTGGNPDRGGRNFPRKVLFHRSHTRIYKQ